MAEALLYFWKKTFQLLNKLLEGGQVEKSLLKKNDSKNMV